MATSQQRQEENLLACLEQLKQKKVATNLPAICKYMAEQFGTSEDITEANIKKLLKSEIIIQVHQDDFATFIVAKGKLKGATAENGLPMSTTILRELDALMARCVRELNEANGHKGVMVDEITAWLQTNKGSHQYLLDQAVLDVALSREVKLGKLKLNGSGLYVLAKKRGRPFGSGLRSRSSLDDSKKANIKRKRIKKTNTDYELYEHSNAAAADGAAICDYCLQTAAHNRRGEYEALLMCKDCPAKAHASCMHYSSILAHRAHLSPWQCIDCKTCSKCLDAGDPDDILFCDACDKGYHMSCHDPVVTEKPTGKWACSSCLQDGVSTDDLVTAAIEAEGLPDEVFKPNPVPPLPALPVVRPRNGLTDDSGLLPTPSASPTNMATRSPSPLNNSLPINSATRINLAPAHWTVSDVVQYITDNGFPSEAEKFREQEIDGKSLMLLMRRDMLSNLSLRLGPALKIYEKVKALQKGNSYI